MDYYWQIWHGQLLVGSKDLGQVTIWSVDNTDIPAIGGSLKMTYIAKYDDLWHKILRCEPCTLSLKESVVINGRHVSVFKMSSDTPQFLKLTEEMTEVLHKPRMLTCQFLNPGIRVEVVLVPCCTELQQLGVTDAQIDSQPSLVIIFISSESVDTAVGIPRRMDMNDSSSSHSEAEKMLFCESCNHPHTVQNSFLQKIKSNHKSVNRNPGYGDNIRDSDTRSEHLESQPREKKNVTPTKKTCKSKCKPSRVRNDGVIEASKCLSESPAKQIEKWSHSHDTVGNSEDQRPGIIAGGKSNCVGKLKECSLNPEEDNVQRNKAKGKDESAVCQEKSDVVEKENIDSHIDMKKIDKNMECGSDKKIGRKAFKWHISRFIKKTRKSEENKREKIPGGQLSSENREQHTTTRLQFDSLDFESSMPQDGAQSEFRSVEQLTENETLKMKSVHSSLKVSEGENLQNLKKCSFLDSRKLCDIFSLGDTSKPDLIKPSMLKKNGYKQSPKRSCNNKVTTPDLKSTKISKNVLEQNVAYKMGIPEELCLAGNSKIETHIGISKGASQVPLSSQDQVYEDVELHNISNYSSEQGLENKKDDSVQVTANCSSGYSQPKSKPENLEQTCIAMPDGVACKDSRTSQRISVLNICDGKVKCIVRDLESCRAELENKKLKVWNGKEHSYVNPDKQALVILDDVMEDFSKLGIYSIHDALRTSVSASQLKKVLSKKAVGSISMKGKQLPTKSHLSVILKTKTENKSCELSNGCSESYLHDQKHVSHIEENIELKHSHGAKDTQIPASSKANSVYKTQKKRQGNTSSSLGSEVHSVDQPATGKTDDNLVALSSEKETCVTPQSKITVTTDVGVKQHGRDLQLKRKLPRDKKLKVSPSKMAHLDQETVHLADCHKYLKHDDAREVNFESFKDKSNYGQNSREIPVPRDNSEIDSLTEGSANVKSPINGLPQIICSPGLEMTSDLVLTIQEEGGYDHCELDRSDNEILCEETKGSEICHSGPNEIFCEETKGSEICHPVPPLTDSGEQCVSLTEHGLMDFELTKEIHNTSVFENSDELTKADHSSRITEDNCQSKMEGCVENTMSLQGIDSFDISQLTTSNSENLIHQVSKDCAGSVAIGDNSLRQTEMMACIHNENNQEVSEQNIKSESQCSFPTHVSLSPASAPVHQETYQEPGYTETLPRKVVVVMNTDITSSSSCCSVAATESLSPHLSCLLMKDQEHSLDSLYQMMGKRFEIYSEVLGNENSALSDVKADSQHHILPSEQKVPFQCMEPELPVLGPLTPESLTQEFRQIMNIPCYDQELRSSFLKVKSILYDHLQSLHAVDQKSELESPKDSSPHSSQQLSKAAGSDQDSTGDRSLSMPLQPPSETASIHRIFINPLFLPKIQSWYTGNVPLNSIVFKRDEMYQLDWSSVAPISSEETQNFKRISLFGASDQDITKIMCQLMTHKWSYRCLNDIKEYGGRVYVQASGLKSFFKDSGLWNLCAKNNVEFRVYNSLSGILSNETVPILSGGWLVLLHHSVLDVRLLSKVLMGLLKDGKNDGQQNKIYIPALTFRKYIQLCINTGLAHVISSEGPWRNLGPDSSVSELLNCLAVIHQCFKHVHRHPTVLVSHCVRTRNQTNFYRLYQLSNFYPKFILGHS